MDKIHAFVFPVFVNPHKANRRSIHRLDRPGLDKPVAIGVRPVDGEGVADSQSLGLRQAASVGIGYAGLVAGAGAVTAVGISHCMLANRLRKNSIRRWTGTSQTKPGSVFVSRCRPVDCGAKRSLPGQPDRGNYGRVGLA